MRYVLLFLAAPGSFVLIGLMVRGAMRLAARWREDEEDADRALRIQKEYGVTADAVEPPKGKRRRRGLPEIRSDYRGFRDEVSR